MAAAGAANAFGEGIPYEPLFFFTHIRRGDSGSRPAFARRAQAPAHGSQYFEWKVERLGLCHGTPLIFGSQAFVLIHEG